MRSGFPWLPAALLALVVGLLVPTAPSAVGADIVGAATVLADGSLRISSKRVWLYGIYSPPSGKSCVTFLRPARCGSRAALALETKIQGFVHCQPVGHNPDGSVNAFCFIRRTFYSAGDDLAAFLVEHGLALALPGAPFEYFALERIAQTRHLGIWGFAADSITTR
jgi:endonuclease YncB( thermonuclease family)